MSAAGTAALRARVDQCASSGDWTVLPNAATPPTELEAFSREYAVAPCLLALVGSLASGDAGFWRGVADGLGDVDDTRALTARWIEWFWADPETGIATQIPDPRVRADGQAVCDAHRRAASGEVIGREEWRRLRAALSRVEIGDQLVVLAAGVGAAAAWNLGSVPAAVADMVQACVTLRFAQIDRDMDWNAQKNAAAKDRVDRMSKTAQEAAQAAVRVERSDPAIASREAQQDPVYQKAFQKALADFKAADPSESDVRGERRMAAFAAVYELGRAGLARQIAACAAAGAVPVVA